jgi:hypothetical protein
LLALTVSVAELPAAIDAGLAVMLTLGFAWVWVPPEDPHPAAMRRSTARPETLPAL